MIGEQVDPRREEQLDAALARADEPRILAAPEVAVVHEQSVGADRGRGLDQRGARGHPGDERGDLGATFHLQPVWAIILDTGGVEELVEMAGQFVA